MSYITQTWTGTPAGDLTSRLGNALLTRMFCTSTGTLDGTAGAAAVADADSEVDSILGPDFTVPITGSVAAVIVRCACDMAAFFAYENKPANAAALLAELDMGGVGRKRGERLDAAQALGQGKDAGGRGRAFGWLQPAAMEEPYPDANCLKCHAAVTQKQDFNNHFHGYAPENCLYLIQQLGLASEEQKKARANFSKQLQLGDFSAK